LPDRNFKKLGKITCKFDKFRKVATRTYQADCRSTTEKGRAQVPEKSAFKWITSIRYS